MLDFIPALATTLHMPLGTRAVFTLTNADLDQNTTTAQVWTNIGGDWRGFDLLPVPPEADPPPSSWHLRLAPAAPVTTPRPVPQSHPVPQLYQARITPQSNGSYSFTYRLRNHQTGAIEWLGDEHNNGTVVIDANAETSSNGLPCLEGAQARAWTQASPHVVARFAASHAVYGWAITIRSSHVQSQLAHIRLESSGWALVASSGHARARSISPDEHFNFLVLFSPCWDSPLCFSGDGLTLETHGDAPLVRSRGHVQTFWRCDRSVLQGILNKPEAPDLILLRSESTHFVAIYSKASASVHVLPASLPIGQWSTVGVHGLDSLAQSPHLALHAPASHHARFHSSASASVLVPPPGGHFTVSAVKTTELGDRVAVLQPRDSVLAPNAISSRSRAQVLQPRSKLSPAAMLWTLLLYIVGALVRSLQRLGPVRRIVPLVERCEHLVVQQLSQRFGTPIRSVANRLGYRATGADGDGTSATTRAATFFVATKQNIPDGALLLVHNISRRSDDVSGMPAIFCDDKQLKTDSATTPDGESGPVMLAVKLPAQFDTATGQRTLRVEF